MALVDGPFCEEDFELLSTIWAFCLMTSAGVRMAQETSSASAEAAELMIGAGTWSADDEEALARERSDLVPS